MRALPRSILLFCSGFLALTINVCRAENDLPQNTVMRLVACAGTGDFAPVVSLSISKKNIKPATREGGRLIGMHIDHRAIFVTGLFCGFDHLGRVTRSSHANI